MATDDSRQLRGNGEAYGDRNSGVLFETLGDYLDLLLRRIWMVFAVLIAAVFMSVIYAVTRTPLYTSVATIVFDEKKPMPDGQLYTGSGAVYELSPNYLDTQMEIIKSRTMAEALVSRMNLLESPEFNAQGQGWSDSISGLPSTLFSLLAKSGQGDRVIEPAETSLGRICKIIEGSVMVNREKKSNLVVVSITATKPGLSKKMLENYLSLYEERNLEQRRRGSLAASQWLKDELQKAEKKLMDSKEALVHFIIDNHLVVGKSGSIEVLDVMDKILDEQIKSQGYRLRMQALQDQKGTEQGAVLPKDFNTDYVGKMKEQLAQNEAEYTQLKGVYAPTYPKMTSLAQKIEFLRARISEIEKGLINTVVDTAKAEEGLFKQSFEKARLESEKFKTLESQLTTLKQVEQTNEEFFKIILKEFKEQEIKSRTITNNVRIVDAPSLPAWPSWPRKSLIVFVGCALGLCLGIAGAFAMENLDSRINSPRQIEQGLHVKNLVVVPDAEKIGQFHSKVGGVIEPEFVARQKPRSPISDAIRNLQVCVFWGDWDHPVRTVVVTSATPSEGKTFISVSTATVLASERRNAVLIDADLRRPRIHRVFKLNSPAPGLAEFLGSSNVTVPEIVRNTPMTGLSYIPSGESPEDPAELLQSDRMGALVRELRETYDYLIFDTPSLLGMADVQFISRQADGLLLVAKQGHVHWDELREAIRVASSFKECKLLGVVFNKAYAPRGYRYGCMYGRARYRPYFGYHQDGA